MKIGGVAFAALFFVHHTVVFDGVISEIDHGVGRDIIVRN